MEHLNVLNPQQLEAVNKFKEYGAVIQVGVGNKATWSDLVHTDAYSNQIIDSKLGQLTAKVNQQELLKDENEDASEVNETEFSARSGSGTSVAFTTKECQLVLRAAKKVRKYFIDQKEVASIDAQMEKLKKRLMTPAQRVEEEMKLMEERRRILTGGKEPVATPVAEVQQAVNQP